MNRGPHTGLEPGTLASDMDPTQLKSTLSNFDFDELIKTHLPSTAGIQNVAIFDIDDLQPVGASGKAFSTRFAPAADDSSEEGGLRTLVDIFTSAGAPAASTPAEASSGLSLGHGGKYTVSGPRGGQFPLDVIVLHGKDALGQDEVLFASKTASVLVLVQASAEVSAARQREREDREEAAAVHQEKDTVYSAVRSFTQALTSRGV